MKLALLSDAHANVWGLDRAIRDAKRRGAERFYFLGDAVGLGPAPRETVALLRAEGISAIRGNVDRNVQDSAKKKKRYAARGKWEKAISYPWSLAQLDSGARAWLANLPDELVVYHEDHLLHFVHGTPDGDDDYLESSSPRAELNRHLAARGADLLAAGHSHEPFVLSLGKRLVVNTGSVGRPYHGAFEGTYALVETGPPVTAEIVRYPLPRPPLAAAFRKSGLPPAFAKAFLEARPFTRVEIEEMGEGA